MIKRELYYELLKYIDTKDTLVVTGMRQVGKTTLFIQLIEQIKSPHKIIIDLENPLNQKYFEEINYDRINVSLRELAGASKTDKTYVFLDEIQNVKNLPSIIKYLYDHYNYKFFLTGSISFYLKNLFSESLAGRKFLFELYPLSFSEFLKVKGSTLLLPKSMDKVRETTYEQIQPEYAEYIKYGAFPSVVNASSRDEKIRRINDIFTSYFEKEVAGYADFKKNRVVRDLMLLLLNRTGSKLETNKICSELGISRITLNDYLSFLEGSYFIKTVRPYSRNIDVEIRETPKVYVCDAGLANILGRASFGHVFETMIFHQMHLLKVASGDIRYQIQYYQRKNGAEIDFITNQTLAYEVKETADRRDADKLRNIALELKMKESFVVSYNYTKNIRSLYGFQL